MIFLMIILAVVGGSLLSIQAAINGRLGEASAYFAVLS